MKISRTCGAKVGANVFAALAVLVLSAGACARSEEDTEVLVIVENDSGAPAPEVLHFSWLDCDDFVLRDTRVPDLELPQEDAGQRRPAPCAAAAELVGLHGDVDAGRATLQAAWQASPLAPSRTSSRPG